ncbi:MAG: hypothetical protein EZS28_054053 [Streblomastix strix]|uniref:Uncharacterized protein n=1 Tax=Streblomastix strix TaxID=222440 RepID=A0A5J4QVP6_9EUKA|nr:MAG: hypothetical protein EZS28_054053 [Streblomastix strix]
MSFVTLSVGNATSDLQLSSQYNPHQNTQFIFGVNVPIQEGYKIDRDVFKEKKMTVRFACLLIDLLQALIDAYSSDLFPLVNTAQLLYFIDQCSNSNGDGYTILKKKGRQLKKSLMKIASLLNERR